MTAGAPGFTTLEREPDDFYGRNLVRVGQVARDAGAISEAEHRAWTEALRAVGESGMFLAGITHLFVWGGKPR